MDLSVFFAGTAGSVPSARRGLPAVLLRRGGDAVLFDCGEGTQRQLVRSVGLADVSHVFLTHFHADHWLGLPGMLKSFDLRDRERPLTVLGPPGTTRLLEAARFVYGRLKYPFEIRELDPAETVRFGDWYVAPFPVEHRGPVSFGYAVVEDTRRGRFDSDLATSLGVSFGPDFGRLARGETVAGIAPEQVMGPDRPGRKVVLSGDTVPCETVRVAAHQADVLIHEATFASEEVARATQTRHSTARQAAEIAARAEVRMLALTHLSSRYAGGEIRDEARTVFEPTVVPRDFDTIEVPYPEKGVPRLVRWDTPPQGAEPAVVPA